MSSNSLGLGLVALRVKAVEGHAPGSNYITDPENQVAGKCWPSALPSCRSGNDKVDQTAKMLTEHVQGDTANVCGGNWDAGSRRESLQEFLNVHSVHDAFGKHDSHGLQVAFSQLLAHKCLLANEGAQGRMDVAERCWIAFNDGARLSNSDRFSHIPYKFLQWRAHRLRIVANHIGQCPWGSILSWLINHPQNR